MFPGGQQQYHGVPSGFGQGQGWGQPGGYVQPANAYGQAVAQNWAAPPGGVPSLQGGYAPGQQPQYGAQQQPQYGTPSQQPQYGTPPQQQQQPQYGAQQQPQQQYGGRPPSQYAGQSQPPQYGGYQQPSYAAPPQPQLPPAPPGVPQDIWQWFVTVDADRSGKITSEELRLALMNGNWTPFNQETCRLMIGMFDRDRNGTIDVYEFGALWKYIQDWKACFDSFDRDRSGSIDTNELHSAFRTFGYTLSPQFCQLCIRVFDRHQTSGMKFDDFIQCCVMLKTLTDKFRVKDTSLQGIIRISYEEFLEMVLEVGATK